MRMDRSDHLLAAVVAWMRLSGDDDLKRVRTRDCAKGLPVVEQKVRTFERRDDKGDDWEH